MNEGARPLEHPVVWTGELERVGRTRALLHFLEHIQRVTDLLVPAIRGQLLLLEKSLLRLIPSLTHTLSKYNPTNRSGSFSWQFLF